MKEAVMYLNVYAASKIAEERLSELRAERARIALLESVQEPRAPLAARVGAALIRVGQWLSAAKPVPRDPARDGRGGDWRRAARTA